MEATDGFSFENTISKGVSIREDGSGREAGAKVPNFVYRGHLRCRQLIAVKRFSEIAWSDAEQFRAEAIAVGRLRHRRLANLIGYCCDGDQRLLANFNNQKMKWARRLRVAYYIAEALEYCSGEGQAVYHDLNSYRVLFDKEGSLLIA